MNATVNPNTSNIAESPKLTAIAEATSNGAPITSGDFSGPRRNAYKATTEAPAQDTSGKNNSNDAISAARHSDAIK